MKLRQLPRILTCSPLLILIAISPVSATGAATISPCDWAGLEAAVAAGGTYSFDCDGVITLTSTLDVTNDLTLNGTGHYVTISGNNAVRLFRVSPGVQLKLSNLALANGIHRGTNGVPGNPFQPNSQSTPGESAYGGAIYNNGGHVTLEACSFYNNSVIGGLGVNSAGSLPATPGGAGFGGAIYNLNGSLAVTFCTFTQNQAAAGMGGFAFTYPPPADAFGGALCNLGGFINLTNVIFVSNVSTGSISYTGSGTAGPAGDAYGGALHSLDGEVVLESCRFEMNKACGGSTTWSNPKVGKAFGGAISCTNGTILCSTSTLNSNIAIGGFGQRHSSAADGRGGALWLNGTSTLHFCTFKHNAATTQPSGNAGGRGQGGHFTLLAERWRFLKVY